MSKSFAFADKRRVDNLVWAGAHAYDFEPDFVVRDLSGQADFYMNLIMGCTYFRYGQENIRELFSLWQDSYRMPFFDQVTWFGLECAIYPGEAVERPALEELRRDSARSFLSPELDLQRRNFSLQNVLLFELKQAQSLAVLGKAQVKLSRKAGLLYEAFHFEKTPDFAEFRKLLLELYKSHFQLPSKKRRPSAFRRHFLSFWQRINKPLFKRVSMTSNLQKEEVTADKTLVQGAGLSRFSFVKRDDERLRARLTAEFGPPLFEEADQLALEEKLAVQEHKGSRLWICRQRGDYPQARKRTDLHLETLDAQKKKSFQRYRKHQSFYRQSIQRLANYLQLMLASDLVPGYNPSHYGKLAGQLAFKSKIPGQDKIFYRHAEVPAAEHSVDLMLDASASRLGQVEDIAIQSYILAESLERSTIPVRITAYCTLEKYTILSILKDFDEPLDLNKLFSYHALGWNRDGLAYRAMQALLPGRPYHNHLILILTDAAPNDLRPLQAARKLPREYSGKPGLEDAAAGLDILREPGVNIAALVSGVKESHENVHKLFGNRYERLNDTGQLVSKAKKLIYSSI